MNSTFLKLESEIKKRNQFKRSHLTDEIMNVLDCSEKSALGYQKGHCNLVSFWGIMYAAGLYTSDYGEFYRFLRSHNLSDGQPYAAENGWMKVSKSKLPRMLGIDKDVKQLSSIPTDRNPGDLYQVSINGGHHFIAACVADDLQVYIFDTNDRGCPVEIGQGLARKHDKVDWFKVLV